MLKAWIKNTIFLIDRIGKKIYYKLLSSELTELKKKTTYSDTNVDQVQNATQSAPCIIPDTEKCYIRFNYLSYVYSS